MWRLRVATPVVAPPRARSSWLVFERAAQFMQQVEQLGIDRLDFVRAEVAQDVVDVGQRAGVVAPVAAVGRLQPLPGVGVEERQGADGRSGGAGRSGFGPERAERRGGGNSAEAKECAPVEIDPRLIRSEHASPLSARGAAPHAVRFSCQARGPLDHAGAREASSAKSLNSSVITG
jgi:hypothetical protein